MQIYFDTNIYNFIADCNEARQVSKLLESRRHHVRASDENRIEILAIRDRRKLLHELQTCTTVANSFAPKPVSWSQAREVRLEIGRCRSHWLRPVAFLKEAKAFLKYHEQKWQDACQLKIPSRDILELYRRTAEPGIEMTRDFQKEFRQLQLKRRNEVALGKVGDTEPIVEFRLDNPERFWRAESLMVWFNAIEVKAQASRDYADWLLPYLHDGVFRDDSYSDFWLREVRAENMPANRLTALTSLYQMRHKITHGNALDTLHAANALKCDYFITADKLFYNVLVEALGHFDEKVAQVALVDRSAPSALQELKQLL